MRNYIICSKLFILLATCNWLPAQVGINTAMPMDGTSLQIDGSDSGILINRVSLTGRDDITTIPSLTAAHTGLMIFNTATTNLSNAQLNVFPGFYYWTGTSWASVKESGAKKTGWVSLRDPSTSIVITGISSSAAADPNNYTDIPIDFSDPAFNISSRAPEGYTVDDFFDSVNNRVRALELGDSSLVRLQFEATPTSNNAYLVIAMDIAADGDPPIIIYQKTIPLLRGSGEANKVSESILLFQLGTFVANGAKLKIAYSVTSGSAGNVTLSNFSMVINRLSTD